MKALWIPLLLVLLAADSAAGATFTVRPDGTGDFPTIQAAVTAARADDVIELTNGVFVGAGNRNVDYQGKAITIRSQDGNADSCIIDCQGTGRGFAFLSAEGPGSILEGVTITNGNTDPGGAIRCWTSTCPTIRDCRFVNNNAEMIGGAICCVSHSSPSLSSCTFIGNTATFGGAVIGWVDSEPTIVGCTFVENSAWFGGAIESADRAVVAVESCTFRRNAAERGGAVMSEEDGVVTLTGCTFCENEANIGGAGVACEVYGQAYLDNTIIALSTSGEAILLSSTSGATLHCCDLCGNAGGDWVGQVADQLGVDGNIKADPLFCDASTGNLRLHANSPCAPFSPPNPECDLIGAWPVGCDPQGIAFQPAPDRLYLATGSPNPFTDATRIQFAVPADLADAPLQLRVFDLTGRLVRTLVKDMAGETPHTALWNGEDDCGRLLPAGVYCVRLLAGRESVARRVVLTR